MWSNECGIKKKYDEIVGSIVGKYWRPCIRCEYNIEWCSQTMNSIMEKLLAIDKHGCNIGDYETIHIGML